MTSRRRKNNIAIKQYRIVEHLWRLLRAIFLLVGAGLWLYTDVSLHIIFACMACAAVVDQFHGIICHWMEKMLHFKEQHDDWE